MSRLSVVWWGGWPWRWRAYYVHRSQFGPFRELLVGPVSFVWVYREERNA